MQRVSRLLSIVFACFTLLGSSATAGGPENLLLVVNADSPSSLLIANHYIELRQIPERNVVYLSGIPDREIIKLSTFRSKVLGPVLSKIRERKLSNSIDYIVYSADFPTTIQVAPDREKLIEIAKEKGKPIGEGSLKIFNSNASITSMTYFADSVIQDDPTYMLLNSNYYYRNSAQLFLETPFFGELQEEYRAAVRQSKTDVEGAIKSLEEMRRVHPKQVAVLYVLAKLNCQTGNYERAAELIEESVANGWSFRSFTERDADFADASKKSELVRTQVEKIPDEPFKSIPTVGFKHTNFWSANGSVNSSSDQGRSFFLSTILAVTRNHGCTEAEALASLKLNSVVDGTNPKGTFYFAETKDKRTTTRQPNHADAIEALKGLGHKTRIIKDAIPIGQDDVLGLTMGAANFKWKSGGSEIVPGAICDNLTSYGGVMYRAGQTKCTEFLVNRAAGASGTVVEPYALQAKFPHPLIHAHYARGATLAEAFYQSVHGPFQLLIVGDALCKPFAAIPALKATGVEPESVISGAIEISLDFSESPVTCSTMELYFDGQLIKTKPVTESFRFDSNKIADGYHEIRVVGIADGLLATTGSTVLPVFVNNQGFRVELSTDRNAFRIEDDVKLKVRSNYGERIVLRQNFRELAKESGQEVEFTVPASQLGRGPVKLTAVAFDDKGIPVSSVPLKLEINGDIATTKRDTQTKPK